MGGTKVVCPLPRYYAVIQMDPKTMVKDLQLDDEQALKEVEAMRPQKYLVYLDVVSFVHIYFCHPQLLHLEQLSTVFPFVSQPCFSTKLFV